MGEKKEKKRSVLGDSAEASPSRETRKRYKWNRGPYGGDGIEKPPWWTATLVYFQFTILTLLAGLADWLRSRGLIHTGAQQELGKQKSFPSLDNHFEAMYVNNIYRIASDVVNRPLCGVPSVMMKLKDRETKDYGWTYECVPFSFIYG